MDFKLDLVRKINYVLKINYAPLSNTNLMLCLYLFYFKDHIYFLLSKNPNIWNYQFIYQPCIVNLIDTVILWNYYSKILDQLSITSLHLIFPGQDKWHQKHNVNNPALIQLNVSSPSFVLWSTSIVLSSSNQIEFVICLILVQPLCIYVSIC